MTALRTLLALAIVIDKRALSANAHCKVVATALNRPQTRHDNDGPFFDDDQIARKDIGIEKLIPVAEPQAAANNNWDISDPRNKNVPYLSYDPVSYLGTVVEQVIGSRRPRHALRYMDAHAEALKRRVLAGSGMAWLSDSIVAAELASCSHMPVGGPEWQTSLTLVRQARRSWTTVLGDIVTDAATFYPANI